MLTVPSYKLQGSMSGECSQKHQPDLHRTGAKSYLIIFLSKAKLFHLNQLGGVLTKLK